MNEVSHLGAYSMPWFDELLDWLDTAHLFSKLDLTKDYYYYYYYYFRLSPESY